MWHLKNNINDTLYCGKHNNICMYNRCFNKYASLDYKINNFKISILEHNDTYCDTITLSKHKYILIFDTTKLEYVEFIYYNSILLDVIPIFINKHNQCILSFYKTDINRFNIIDKVPNNINDIFKLYPFYKYLNLQSYIKKNVISNHVNNTINDIEEGITFTITTCKRYGNFVSTMDNFLNNCIDHDKIKKWICIDDNSSEIDRNNMKSRYPFFNFLLKNENEKGHAKSLNLLWKNVNTPFIFQMEDDWLIHDRFSILEIINNFKNYNLTQIILGHCHGEGIKLDTSVNLNKYCYNQKTSIMPQDVLLYKQSLNANLEQLTSNFWWPGFTLHPSIIYYKKIKDKCFSENIKNHIFEYKFSLDLYNDYHKIAYCGLNVGHTGNISSYDLNNEKR